LLTSARSCASPTQPPSPGMSGGRKPGVTVERIEERSRPHLLIADDHAVFAEALRVLLEKTYLVVGIVADGRALVSEAMRLKPDVVVVDVGMPLLNGLDAARRVREQAPNIKLVFLTMKDDPNLAAAALELRKVGFVLKHSAARELLTAIEHVLRNESYVTPRLRAEDWTVQQTRAQQFSKALTGRQRDVVQLFAEGCSIKQIAGHLNLSEKTVEFHKHHIMQSFNLKSNADLVLFALQQGLISIPCGTAQFHKKAS
jgi:DNA-binding NarL/FixJ family response regulator